MHFRPASSVGFVAAEVALGQVCLRVLHFRHVTFSPSKLPAHSFTYRRLVTHLEKLRPPLAAILMPLPTSVDEELVSRGDFVEIRYKNFEELILGLKINTNLAGSTETSVAT
jgi:hypothetical protein